MIKKTLVLVVIALLCSGCVSKELQRSANNKLFDTKGFEKSKRKPLYNQKYINKAKRNIIENNYEDDVVSEVDDPDEFVDPYTQNRIMYSNMVRRDQKRSKKNSKNDYPDIGHARDIARAEGKTTSDDELRKELEEIKSMLSSAKKDLAKYRCPTQNDTLGSNPVKHKISTNLETNTGVSDNSSAAHPAKSSKKPLAKNISKKPESKIHAKDHGNNQGNATNPLKQNKDLNIKEEDSSSIDETDSITDKPQEAPQALSTPKTSEQISKQVPEKVLEPASESTPPELSKDSANQNEAAKNKAKSPQIEAAEIKETDINATDIESPQTTAKSEATESQATSSTSTNSTSTNLNTNANKNPMTIIPSAPGSDHSMINLAPTNR